MSPFEIALIIIGIVCIIVSCFVVEHKEEKTVETELGSVSEQILYSQLSDANAKISEHVARLKTEVYEKTKDEMSQISNQKIMSIHEYSDQVLSDIKKNHEEVMFLYQMLNDKEAELKKSLQEMQQTKREMERFNSMMKDELAENHTYHELVQNSENTSSAVQSKSDVKNVASTIDTENRKSTSTKGRRKKSNSTKDKNLLEITEIDTDNHYTKTLQDIENQEFSSHIEEILEMSSQGLSVIEISKRLGLGQGEVKLVLDYNKK